METPQTKTNPWAEENTLTVKVYGRDAALCFQSACKEGEYSIIMDAAAKISGSKYFDFQGNKAQLQLTRREMPEVLAVLLGLKKQCEFKYHGHEKNKGYSFEYQGGDKILAAVFTKQTGRLMVPIEKGDRFLTIRLIAHQIGRQAPEQNVNSVITLIKHCYHTG